MYRKGEVSTLIVGGVIALVAVVTLISSTLQQDRQTTDTRAAGGCPLVSVSSDLSGKICRVQINYTPGNPSPAAPRTLVCGLINPARSTTIPEDQIIAKQVNKPANYDYFNLTSTGQFELAAVSDFNNKLSPQPPGGNYKLVVYDWNDPTNCVREVAISTATVQSVFGGGGTTPTNTPMPQVTNTPVPQATNTPVPLPTNTPVPNQGGPTSTPVPRATNTPVPRATNTPVPNTTDGRCTYTGDIDCVTLTPSATPVKLPNGNRCTVGTTCQSGCCSGGYCNSSNVCNNSCRPGEFKCPGTDRCVADQGLCASPTPTQPPLAPPPQPTVSTPRSTPQRIRLKQTIENARVCPAVLTTRDNGCIYLPMILK